MAYYDSMRGISRKRATRILISLLYLLPKQRCIRTIRKFNLKYVGAIICQCNIAKSDQSLVKAQLPAQIFKFIATIAQVTQFKKYSFLDPQTQLSFRKCFLDLKT